MYSFSCYLEHNTYDGASPGLLNEIDIPKLTRRTRGTAYGRRYELASF